MKISIRKAQAEDFEAIYKINALAFGQKDEAKLVETIRDTPEYLPNLEFVALQDQNVVGHILYSKVRIGNIDCQAVALAPMSVLPSFQNRGIGSKLIEQSLTAVESEGFKSVLVLGHQNYYPRFGFKPASIWGVIFPQEVPEEAFMALSFTPDGLKSCSGVVRYSSAFGI